MTALQAGEARQSRFRRPHVDRGVPAAIRFHIPHIRDREPARSERARSGFRNAETSRENQVVARQCDPTQVGGTTHAEELLQGRVHLDGILAIEVRPALSVIIPVGARGSLAPKVMGSYSVPARYRWGRSTRYLGPDRGQVWPVQRSFRLATLARATKYNPRLV